MSNTIENLFEYIEAHTLRLEASRRGGGIEIDAEDYLDIEGACMTAYQNYLGGGMTGSIQNSFNFGTSDKDKLARAEALAQALQRYFYNITNDLVQDWDEFAASDSFAAQQARPGSAY